MSDRIWLFCYGTLMSEEVYASVMAKALGPIDPIIREPGRLQEFKRYCVKNAAYPAITPFPGSFVDGLVAHIPSHHLKTLDVFEGDEYKREQCIIQTKGGSIEAHVYTWSGSLNRLEDREWEYSNFRKVQSQWISTGDDYFAASERIFRH